MPKVSFKGSVSVAIAGGGCRAFYGLGLLAKFREWGLPIREMSGVSAGAAMILASASEVEEHSVEYFEELTKRNPSNFHLSEFLQGNRFFPHENMYRRTIRNTMNWEKIRQSPIRFFIQAVRAVPKDDNKSIWKLAKLVTDTANAFIKDEKDRQNGIPASHVPEVCKKWNLEDVVFTNADFQSPEIVEQIILNSSSIYPVVSLQKKSDEYYLDGGLTNNLLMEVFQPKNKKIGIYYQDTTIVGKSPELLQTSLLIRPEAGLPITSFDYANPVGVRATFELGKSDAEKRKDEIFRYLQN